jgi:cation:H+ antiporter
MLAYLLLIFGLFMLLIGGKFLVDGASSIAFRLGMSSGLIGLTVVAFGTSAPELLVSLTAAVNGNSAISIGNVIGSNIANIGLVLGLSGIFYPILIQKAQLKLEYAVMLLVTFIFYFLSLDQEISFWDGLILIAGLIIFNFYMLRNLGKEIDSENKLIQEEFEGVRTYNLWISSTLVMGGILGLYFGSELLVHNAVLISREFGISERVIGITIIAIGTSIPELITSIFAALSKRTDLALGNILGSNIMNILSIIGITALVKPIEVSKDFLGSDYLWMVGLSIILFPLMKTKMRVSKIEGSFLLLIYLIYLYFLL